jgi:topoisomerase-4 subunit B
MGSEVGMPSVRTFINDFVKTKLDTYTKIQPADALLRKKFFRRNGAKELSGIRKLAKDRAKKSNLHNKKLRDCRAHLTDTKTQETWKVRFFITEASGSITKSRDVNTRSFSLRGKPLNSYGMNKNCL